MELETIAQDITQGSMHFNSTITGDNGQSSAHLKGGSVKFKVNGEAELKTLAAKMAPRIRNAAIRGTAATFKQLAITSVIMAKMIYAERSTETAAMTLELLGFDCGLEMPPSAEFLKTVIGYLEWFSKEKDPAERQKHVDGLAEYLQKNCSFVP